MRRTLSSKDHNLGFPSMLLLPAVVRSLKNDCLTIKPPNGSSCGAAILSLAAIPLSLLTNGARSPVSSPMRSAKLASTAP